MDKLVDRVHSSVSAIVFKEVLVPGEIEHRLTTKRSQLSREPYESLLLSTGVGSDPQIHSCP